jgi:hypothetical protein
VRQGFWQTNLLQEFLFIWSAGGDGCWSSSEFEGVKEKEQEVGVKGGKKRCRFAEGFGAMEVPFALVALPLGLMFFISGFILNVLQVRKKKKSKGKGKEGYGVGWDGMEWVRVSCVGLVGE